MPIELARIQLDRVHKVDTLERAALIHHRVPGLEGNLTQNLGRDSVRLQIEGIFYGRKAADEMATLRKAYKAREPVDFLADVVGQAYFSQVVLEAFEVVQVAQAPEQFSYRLTIAEYVPVKKAALQTKAAVNNAIKQQAGAMVELASLPDAIKLGSIPNLSNPAAPLTSAISPITDATAGLANVGAEFDAISTLQIDAPNSAAPTVEKAEIELSWNQDAPAKSPNLSELVEAGVPLETLIEQGAEVDALLASGATANELLATGIDSEALLAGGLGEDDLAVAEQVQAVLATKIQPFWVAIALKNTDQTPLANQPYLITQSDGVEIAGTLDAQGTARIETRTSKCTISFPNLDDSDWQILAESEPAKPEPIPTEPPRETHWLSFEVVDDTGEPLAQEKYRVVGPNNTPYEGQLDELGRIRLSNLPPGSYQLSLPNLDADDWQSSPQAGD